jgi:ribose transport system permease protein
MEELVRNKKSTVHHFAIYGGLIVCLIVFTLIPPLFGESIWAGAKLTTLISDVVVIMLMSVGCIFVYAVGNMDISIGRRLTLCNT